ncbi:MAG: EF-hand domain-containing protein [Chromatiales bacterium]|nr:EF-hand domain-containing protein [Chromatiales bacterium]
MKMEPGELKELSESFRYNDTNKDGLIGFAEFVEMLGQLEADVGDDEARIGFDEVDTDDDGAISFDEFVAWWRDR